MIDSLAEEVEIVERHLQVFSIVIEDHPIGIMKLSKQTGYAHHEIRYSLRELEENSLIEPTQYGAVPTEKATEFASGVDDKIDALIRALDAVRTERFDQDE